MPLDAVTLDTWVGANVRDFCHEDGGAFRRHNDTNHCAHFVAHVLGLLSPPTDADLRGRRRDHGASPELPTVAVNLIAFRCQNFREIVIDLEELRRDGENYRYPPGTGLVFVTLRGHLRLSGVGPESRCTNLSNPRHVGFYIGGQVWHYENDPTYERVVTHRLDAREAAGGRVGTRDHPVPETFHHRYGRSCVTWLADAPPGCVARTLFEAQGPGGEVGPVGLERTRNSSSTASRRSRA